MSFVLVGKQLVVYIDNEAARAALVKGCSTTEAGMRKCLNSEAGHGRSTSYGRVGSHSNIADSPSRLDFDNIHFKEGAQLHVDWIGSSSSHH